MSRSEQQHYTKDDLKVMTVPEWAQSNSLSLFTAKAIIARGEGPPVIQLSKRRIGIRVIDNARWQEQRIRD
jgi:hypothetical protein